MGKIKVIGDINNNNYDYLRSAIDSNKDIVLLGNYFSAINNINDFTHLISSNAKMIKGKLESDLENFLLDTHTDDTMNKKLIETLLKLYNDTSNKNITNKYMISQNEQNIREVIISNYYGITEYLQLIPLYLEYGNHIFVHGAINTGIKDWRNTTKETMLNGCQSVIGNLSNKIIVTGTFKTSNRKWFRKRFDPVVVDRDIIVLNSQKGTSEVVINY